MKWGKYYWKLHLLNIGIFGLMFLLALMPDPLAFSDSPVERVILTAFSCYFWVIPAYRHFTEIPSDLFGYALLGINIAINSLIIVAIAKYIKS